MPDFSDLIERGMLLHRDPEDEYALLEYEPVWDGLDGAAAQLAAAIRVFVITRDPLDWLPERGSEWATANADGDLLELPVYVTRARVAGDTAVLAELARRVLVNAIGNQGMIFSGAYPASAANGAARSLLAAPEACAITAPPMCLRSTTWEPLGLGALQDLVQDAFGPVDLDRSLIRLDPVAPPEAGCPACDGETFGFPADITVAAATMCKPHYKAATAVIDARIGRARASNPAGWRALGEASARTSGTNEPPDTPQPVRPTVTVGRNDPCPCGSGKKYKRCRGS